MTTLENKDCLNFVRSLESESVDMVLVDPPYFIGFDGGKGWDNQWKSEDEYLNWCAEWSSECVRVLRPNRMMVVWGTLKTDTFLKYKLNVLNSYSEMSPQNEIVWSYNWGGRSKNNFARKHEYAWCYSKGSSFLFNSDEVLVERKVKKNLRTGGEYEKGTIPTCVWEKNNHTTSKEFCGWHPTTKNLEVLDRMILAYTNKEELVLDLFSGSGSTAMSCLRTGRNFVGCEKDKEYYEKSLQRISEQMRLTRGEPDIYCVNN